jgi:hypothetical protein
LPAAIKGRRALSTFNDVGDPLDLDAISQEYVVDPAV